MKVLLAVDGSAPSLEAARFLSRFPHAETVDVKVLTVIGLPDIPLTASTDLWYGKYVEGQKELGNRVYHEVEGIFEGADVRLEHLSRQGHAGHSIVTAAEETKVDLVVIGSVGHSNLDRLLLGSVSHYVAMHAPVSVLVVRPHLNTRHRDDPLKVTFAYDDSPSAKAAIHEFSRFLWIKNAEIDVLSVVPMHRVFHHGLLPAAYERNEEVLQEVARCAERAADEFRRSEAEVTVTVVEAEHVGERIVSLADHRQPDLIVMGNRGLSGIARALLGSVSQYVLNHSNHSVWIVRHPSGEQVD